MKTKFNIRKYKTAVAKKLVSHAGYTKDEAKKIVESSIVAGDPWGWSSYAIATVSLENGIPFDTYMTQSIDIWCDIDKEVGDCFSEFVNAGVLAVYED